MILCISSPRAESARAVTGRQCPHSGVGEDFLARRTDVLFLECVNSESKRRKINPKVANEPSL